MSNVVALGYLAAAVCFILALRGLSSPATARQGNLIGIAGMAIAVLFTLFTLPHASLGNYLMILIGIAIGGAVGVAIALRIPMTAMPQLIAGFHSLVGMAAVLVAAAALYNPAEFDITTLDGTIKDLSLFEMGLGTIIGAITFSGSVIAFAKLQALMSSAPILLPERHLINAAIGAAILLLLVVFIATESAFVFWLMALLAFAIGFLLIIPIGGADMPVVISMLNSYSGWAAAGIGFTLQNPALIITGALVGSSGAILSYIMCRAMNRSFINVILGGFGETGAALADTGDKVVKPGSAEDAAFIMKNARSVIIVPGYGMAVAQAQHAVREMFDELTAEGVDVKFAIHPVAGRMPGHMNVLLAEANVPYDVVYEMEEINNDFQSADVAYVIGANDITNPAAKDDPSSPIYGMPVLDVDRAKAVFFVKRSMSPGYAGIDNTLFYKDNTMMLFGDAKKMTEEIVRSME
ncbi:MAG TPA: NAD(P)(+) transhydrogenase (Re/Si-specific) subunit beta [Geminicoccaceae bacterium]|jgi:NAD(P) transhydrogenase subunit beta|nr:NAD(P)(+) transhydrogenase (Re/Si-specific) subunit beta [Geminicoccaceae bacterium]